ncbi:MAG: hypothetical protein HY875_06300 [Chloroflexi bacterium]|nr:hypothetical protein [Chloroflexota bacterium]
MDDLEAARFRIYAIEDGAVRAQALAFCLRTGLFDRLEHRALTFDELSPEASLAPRVLPALLAFLCSEGLLQRDDEGRFANTAAASAFLVRTSPRYVGGRGLLFAGFFDAIGHLPGTLASGEPWTPAGQHDMFAGFGAEEQRWFAEGMFANAVHGAKALLEVVDFGNVRRLLDVGGNAGGYALTIAAAQPSLSATIFDVEALRPLAGERIAAAPLEDRVRFQGGSFFEDALPRGHDALLLSSILHDWDEKDCGKILRHCFNALEPGGLIVVTEPMLREDSTGPDHPAASGLTMALLGGENRAPSRVAAMLAAAGFVAAWQSPVGPQNTTVTARKP